MQEPTAEKKPSHSAAKKIGLPWIVRIFLGLGIIIQILAKFVWRLAGKNVPLALGVALFAALFAAVAYNALFRQNSVSRPVLFSTRAVPPAAAVHGAAQNPLPARPFVAKAISTQGLQNSYKAAALPAAPPVPAAAKAKTGLGRDSVAALIAAQEKSIAAAKAPPQAKAAAPVPAARPAERQNRPPPSRERILQAQKSLQKAGDKQVAANGVWDAQTRAAVLRFQKKRGLKPTGQIDAALIAKMRQLRLW